MPVLLWDASALAKRYTPETGSDVVDALFESEPTPRMLATVLGYAECYSILRRRRNRGVMDEIAFRMAKTALRDEVVFDPKFMLLTVHDAAVFDGLRLVDLHNLNATDAAILTIFLSYRASLAGGERSLQIASDQRLLRAAEVEGFDTLNPEATSIDQAQQPKFGPKSRFFPKVAAAHRGPVRRVWPTGRSG